MNAQVLRCCRSLSLIAALMMLAGCCVTPRDAFEHRYRVFQAGQPLPASMEAPLPIQILTERTLPAGALNHSMDQLGEQGFKLNRLEQIPDSGYYVFDFRRPIVNRYLPTKAPMEFTGVYKPAAPGHLPVYYAFTPKYPGYNVTIFGRSGDPIQVYGDWTGDMLRGRFEQTRYTFVLAGDGHSVTAIEETPTPGELQRTVLTLERMESK